MKVISAGALALALVFMSGCGNQSAPGGPGADTGTTAHETTVTPNADGSTTTTTTTTEDTTDKSNTFTITAPGLDVNVKHGQSESSSIGISRGSEFKQDVTLSFENVPTGITITPENPVLTGDETEAPIDVAAAADAQEGEHTITVTATPKSGEATSTTFKVNVKETKEEKKAEKEAAKDE